MLEVYSTVHRHLNHKLNSQSSTFETTHLKHLPLNIFVIHTNFTPVNFSKKHKPLRIGPYKILNHLSEVTYELLSQDGSTFQTHRNHILPYYPKEPIIFPYIKHYHSTPSLINNPDTESYQDTFSRFSSLDPPQTSNHSQILTSSKHKQFNNSPTSVPKYQNLSQYSSLQDNLNNIPISTPTYHNSLHSSSFQDTLDSTIDSHDSDSEMLPNPIYYSNSSNDSFPQFVLLILLIFPYLLHMILKMNLTLKMNLLINELLIPPIIYVHSPPPDITIHPSQTTAPPLNKYSFFNWISYLSVLTLV